MDRVIKSQQAKKQINTDYKFKHKYGLLKKSVWETLRTDPEEDKAINESENWKFNS